MGNAPAVQCSVYLDGQPCERPIERTIDDQHFADPKETAVRQWISRLLLMGIALLGTLGQVAGAAESQSRPSEAVRPDGPSVTESLEAIVTQDGVTVSIAAHEPEVVDPVAIRFDERGRMWVVEMRDYPTGPKPGQPFGGRIRVLSDQDQDGLFETATTFCDELIFPTGVQPYRDGVIVTLAGSIEFLADRDGDLKCDEREVWFRGFDQGNEQLLANHPTLGPDGLVYVANGLRGGNIIPVDAKWDAGAEPLSLGGTDFVFDPRGGFYGRVAGNSQHGLSIDDFGQRVGCSNRNPAIEARMRLEDLANARGLGPADAIGDIARPAGDSKVVAIGESWTTSHTHAGQFSAACGITVGLGTAMPTDWSGDLVVCEPTSYAVQRQRMVASSGNEPKIGRRSERIDDDRELLASSELWFRPVDTAIGLDGALYVVDMCRAVIEHPDWAPQELKHRPDERWGDRRGRIWRVAATSHPAQPSPSIPSNLAQWVDWLNHPNPTQRALATRWLVDADPDRVTMALADPLKQADWSPAGFARGLNLLRAHGGLTDEILVLAMNHSSVSVRRLAANCLRDANLVLPANERQRILTELLNDPDPRVRFDAVGLASVWIGSAEGKETDSGIQVEPIAERIAELIAREIDRPEPDSIWGKRWASLSPSLAAPVLNATLNQNRIDASDAEVAEIVRGLAFQSATASTTTIPRSLPDVYSVSDSMAVVATHGWFQGAASQKRPATDEWAGRDQSWLLKRLPDCVAIASRQLADDSLASHERIEALKLLVQIDGFDQSSYSVLAEMLRDADDRKLQREALPILINQDREPTLRWLEDEWLSLPPNLKNQAFQKMFWDPELSVQLVDWIESGVVPSATLTTVQIDALTGSSQPSIAQRAKKIFSAARKDRQAVVTQYASSLVGTASLIDGKKSFEQHCATCHRIGGAGTTVGPDISDSRTKTPAALLAAILDPNAAIDAGYFGYRVLVEDGRVHRGMLASEDSSGISIRLPGGELQRIERDEILDRKVDTVSLMPEGFERSLTPDQMRDVIGYLKGWRYAQDGRETLEMDSL